MNYYDNDIPVIEQVMETALKVLAVILPILIATFLSGCGKTYELDKIDKALLVTTALATTADAITTRRMLDRGAVELNPIMGEHPSDGKIIAVKAIDYALIYVVAKHLPSKWRKALLGGETAWYTGLAIHNEHEINEN